MWSPNARAAALAARKSHAKDQHEKMNHPHGRHAHHQITKAINHPDNHNKPKLGSGKRFSNLKHKLSDERGVKNPGALAAYIGRKKYGAKKFNHLAAKGK